MSGAFISGPDPSCVHAKQALHKLGYISNPTSIIFAW